MIRRRFPYAAVLLGLAGAACVSVQPAAAPAPSDRSGDWLVTVYYTPVESFHPGRTTEVTGCGIRDCAFGDSLLGSYPVEFVDAVHQEGTGRITSGPHAGGFLNWSVNVGFWIDDAPRDAYGGVLQPYRTAAANTLDPGTRVRVLDCGEGAVHRDVCERLRDGEWRIHDQFTPGFGGDKHIDLYIGEQDRADFTYSPLFTTLRGATVAIG